MNLQDIKLIASAVRAGEESAKKGEPVNPFDGVNEQLRVALHVGWVSQQPMGDSFYPVDALLRFASSMRHPTRFPLRGGDGERAKHLAGIDNDAPIHALLAGVQISPLEPG